PFIPERVDAKAVLRYAPEVIRKPRWLAEWARTRTLPDLSVPNWGAAGEPAPTFFGAYGEWMTTPPPSWDELRWLREEWGGPFMLKGVMRIDDAKRAVDIGATAISVSNHGGNNLDGTPATIRALPPVAAAVGTEIEVLIDGGVRRGGDVVKALALGARAVMIGRAYLWGLAANGQAGVENVLDILRNGIDSALLGLGRSAVSELTPADVLAPPGFMRSLGAGDCAECHRPIRCGSTASSGPTWPAGRWGRSWPFRWGRPSSTARTCRSAPIRPWPPPWPTGWPPPAPPSSWPRCCPTARPASTPPSPARCRSAPRRWSSSSWSWCAAPMPSPASSSSRPT